MKILKILLIATVCAGVAGILPGSLVGAAPAPMTGATGSSQMRTNPATTTESANATRKMVVLGSSVALGYGSSPAVYFDGSYTNGYAGLLTALLTSEGWTVTNISIGGQITANGLSRFNREVVPLAPHYVLIGYSLANEGLAGAKNPSRLLKTFVSNIAKLSGLCRSNGFYPIVTLCYPNNRYSADEYQYIKSANQAINRMDVPSINLLGALDDGRGRWINGYYFDAYHPNNRGYQEDFYAFVPTLFDAIADGKTAPRLGSVTNFVRLTHDDAVPAPITFTPSNTLHSFTMSFRVRSTNSGTIAAVRSDAGYATLEIRADRLVYVSATGHEMAISVNATNGDWHDIALAFGYARTNTALIVDGKLAGNLSEQYVPNQFILGGPAGASGRPATPAVVDFQNWCVYRSPWNLDEAVAQKQGRLQQASMEICATLDDPAFTPGKPAINRAQSLSVAMVNTTNLAAMHDELPAKQFAQRSRQLR